MHEAVSIEVIGHTDTTGIEGTNLLLSQERADAIRGMLLRSGIKPVNLRAEGVGISQPVRSEATDEDRHFNRSVTFKLSFTPQANTALQGASPIAPAGE